MNKPILDFWSHPTSPPRQNQFTALEWLEKQTARYILLEIPVGGGKSQLAMTYSKFLNQNNGDSFILTPQIILQKQYASTFDKTLLSPLYGKGNYKCNKAPNITCDIGSLIGSPCNSCPAKRAREQAQKSPNAVLNYKVALLNFKHTEVFDKRNLMVLDECHQTEEMLCELDAINFTKGMCKKVEINWETHSNVDWAIAWITQKFLPALKIKLDEMEEIAEPILKHKQKATTSDAYVLQTLNALTEQYNSVNELIDESAKEDFENQFVLIHSENFFKFKRLFAHNSFKNILEQKANKFLFMSSTILNPKQFCADIGIDYNQAAFLSLPSDFPAENRPIFFMPKAKMNAQWSTPNNKSAINSLLARTKEIINIHKDQSGIIHTANYAIADWLIDNLEDKITTHNIMHHNPNNGIDRNTIIDTFTNSKKPSILISPSITEGLDLVGDIARFAIFAKIPFAFLGDQWIKRRMDMSSEWYLRRALIDVIQGSGRIVRSKEDWGNVYILDSSWSYLLKQASHHIPKWWLEAYCEYQE